MQNFTLKRQGNLLSFLLLLLVGGSLLCFRLVLLNYDATGKKGLLSTKVDGNSHTTTYAYTVRNQVSSATYPDSTVETYTYDAAGNLATYKDGKNQTTSYTYDSAGRNTLINYPSGVDPSFTFDNADRLTGMTDTSGTTGYTYDTANRLTQISQPFGTVSYAYDNAGKRTGTTLTGTGSWTYAYDAAARLTSLTNPYSETTAFAYDNLNRTTTETLANGSTSNYTYNADSDCTDIHHKTSGNATLARMQYTYDGVGNVLTRTDTQAGVSSTVNLGYDNANQLTSEARTGSSAYSASYTYDHNGNRLTKVLGGVTDTYTYDAGDKLLTAGNKSYTYDANGNCTAVTVGGLTTSLAYDYENRVTQLTYSNSSTNTFTYNAANLRLKKVDSTGTQNYITDGVSPASPVLQDSGATYTPGISERRGGASKYQHGDLTGNSRALSDSSQAVSDSWVYDGFGMVANRTGTTATPFGYGGGEQYQSDAQSGLMLLGNRYYDSSVGRFISRDPAKSGSNWFAYCDNNPLNSSDPTGLMAISDDGGVVRGNGSKGIPSGEGGDLIDIGSNLFGGWGNHLSGGITGNIVDLIGAGGFVDQDSVAYKLGVMVGLLHELLMEAAADGAEGTASPCFVAGTAIQMADGTRKPIEQVKAGDWVASRNAEKAEKSKDKLKSSENVGKEVTRTFITERKSTLNVTFSNGEAVQCTTGHPFYVEGKGFVPAGRLAVGNAIVTRAGPSVKVRKVEQSGTATVYNFEVEGTHTYFVGKTGAWVHNDCLSDEGGGVGGRSHLSPLPRGKGNSWNAPDPTAGGRPHTVIGMRNEPKMSPEPYRQGMSYGEGNTPLGRTDISDHGRPWDHHNPHFHPWDPIKGAPSNPSKPIPPWKW